MTATEPTQEKLLTEIRDLLRKMQVDINWMRRHTEQAVERTVKAEEDQREIADSLDRARQEREILRDPRNKP